MNIFSTDFFQAFRSMLKEALRDAVKEILVELGEEEKFFLNRKEIAEAIGCDVTTFDECYRYRPGFPYHKKGNSEVWNKKEVFEYMHENKLIK